MTDSVFVAATTWVQAGFSLYPVDSAANAGGDKGPAFRYLPKNDKGKPTWKPYIDRLPTGNELSEWFAGPDPAPGFAVISGPVSGGLEVLDFDDRTVFDAWSAAVEDASPGLRDTLAYVETPGGGVHVYYRARTCSDKCATLAERPGPSPRNPGSKSRSHSLVELKAVGGCVHAPGSLPEVHPANWPYMWDLGCEGPDDVPTIGDDDKEVIIAEACRLNEVTDGLRPLKFRAKDARSNGNGSGDGGVPPWDDFNAEADFSELLIEDGWAFVSGDSDDGGASGWRRPGKAKGRSSATLGYVRDKDGRPLLRNFSSNAGGLELRVYDPAGYLAFFRFGGNFTETARYLMAQGYGARSTPDARPAPGNGQDIGATVDEGPDDDDDTPIVRLSDFEAFLPSHHYIYCPTGEPWPSSSVNSQLPPQPTGGEVMKDGKLQDEYIAANQWLDKEKPIHQMAWVPGEPKVIGDRLMDNGGWFDRPGSRVFNLYRPPREFDGNPDDVGFWLNHLENIYPEHVDHLIAWMAHRAQNPGVKINHAIVLGGNQGIGKDTLLEPLRHAVGPWNFADVSPAHIMKDFNSFAKCVVLRINEGRDLGDVDRFSFYDHMKTYIASPPETLRVNEKNIREYYVLNVMGVIITTNEKETGIYIPPDDRRHYVAWSERTKADFSEAYWNTLWTWYSSGGLDNVAVFLMQYDLSGFDPKASPPKTEAFQEIVIANSAVEDAELADALESLGFPEVITIDMICGASESDFQDWLRDRKNQRRIPLRMSDAGYSRVRNQNTTSGLWSIDGKRQAVYARKSMSEYERSASALSYAEGRNNRIQP